MQCSRRSISWTSFSSPWVRAQDGSSSFSYPHERPSTVLELAAAGEGKVIGIDALASSSGGGEQRLAALLRQRSVAIESDGPVRSLHRDHVVVHRVAHVEE